MDMKLQPVVKICNFLGLAQVDLQKVRLPSLTVTLLMEDLNEEEEFRGTEKEGGRNLLLEQSNHNQAKI